MYYRIDVTCTGKTGKDDFSTFDNISKSFGTIKEVKEWLKEQYGKCKRIPMYSNKDNKAAKVGYIYCFKNADWSHAPVKHWYQRDWVEVKEVQESTVVV